VTSCASSSCIVQSETYYYQDMNTLSYSVVDGGTGYLAAPLYYFSYGSLTSITLATTPTVIWMDHATTWTTLAQLPGSGGGEGWNSPVSSGTSSPGEVINLVYTHQYYVSTAALPASGGSVLPASGWQNADATIAISAPSNSGYAFTSWSWTGSIIITSTSSSSTSAQINGAGTITANFVPLYSVTVARGTPCGGTTLPPFGTNSYEAGTV